MRQVDTKLQSVILEYTAKVSDNVVRKRTPRNMTMVMLESVIISTSIILEKIGEMMTKKAYRAFAATAQGGSLIYTVYI